VPWPWEVEVLLDVSPERAAERLPATLAELAPEGEGTLLRMRVSSLDWMAGVLAGLGCGLSIRRPDELNASVAALARRLLESASSKPPFGRVPCR
jgi:predicted DNA-binding transcriptional regulator YafY